MGTQVSEDSVVTGRELSCHYLQIDFVRVQWERWEGKSETSVRMSRRTVVMAKRKSMATPHLWGDESMLASR